jgi:hypothetical protein
MKICPDCYAANRSYHSYCQKCSGALTNRGVSAYPSVKIRKVADRRRVPAKFTLTT